MDIFLDALFVVLLSHVVTDLTEPDVSKQEESRRADALAAFKRTFIGFQQQAHVLVQAPRAMSLKKHLPQLIVELIGFAVFFQGLDLLGIRWCCASHNLLTYYAALSTYWTLRCMGLTQRRS